MSDVIVPIQCDASGFATFQKIQTYEVPESAADSAGSKPVGAAQGPSALEGADALNLSRPIKKRLAQRTSYFSAQMPAVAIQRQQLEQIQGPYKKQLEQTESNLKQRRQLEQPKESYFELLEQAQTAYQRRLEQPQGLGNQQGSGGFNQQQHRHQNPPAHYSQPGPKQPGLFFSLIR